MQTTTELERSQVDVAPPEKKKILFVDDEQNFLDGIRRMLRDQRDRPAHGYDAVYRRSHLRRSRDGGRTTGDQP